MLILGYEFIPHCSCCNRGGQYDRKSLARYVALAECRVNVFEIELSSVRAIQLHRSSGTQKTVCSRLPGIPLALHTGLSFYGPTDRIFITPSHDPVKKKSTYGDKKWVNPLQPHTIFAPTNTTVSICGRGIPSRFRHNHGNTPEGR